MRSVLIGSLAALLVFGGGMAAQSLADAPQMARDLKQASDFDSITDKNQRSLAIYAEMTKVLMHPRCLNCHPAGETPTQGDAMIPHQPHVVRGDGDIGAPGMYCNTCHHDTNYDPAGVPGNPKWHTAPIEMAWQGKTPGEICAQIKDPARNGGMSLDDLVKHNGEDSLVGWGWDPGKGRSPAPGTQKQFGELTRAWVDTGAACPS